MCVRYTLHSAADAVALRFDIDLEGLDLRPRYNVCSTQDVLAVAVDTEGERRRRSMRSDFVPFWEPRV